MPDHDTVEKVRLTADTVALARRGGTWHVLLIERGWPPFAGQWAFPGGHVDPGETFLQAAGRELAEETGVQVADLRQLGIYDDPGRDPRGRYVTVAFFAVLPEPTKTTAGDDARTAAWVPLTDAARMHLAFDHDQILADVTALVPDFS
ncbi:NUDIX hydrolase [Amycolatopsis sp. PS_44_ISF1]|uniref:NUDIX hydrolase n=1 Tax=Amycolatopsis sp. PS_44_ISF1 TaxID=2974917 RepID=UPI0028DD6820|nr:NUDIX hydrolase [Amycolatopsis sp. PS_44_ISF1]MDT8916226.1 NUDIX hydrolase [Amycolatopsis sp. PS_44_ISF1]